MTKRIFRSIMLVSAVCMAREENHGTWSGRIYHVGHKLNGTDGV